MSGLSIDSTTKLTAAFATAGFAGTGMASVAKFLSDISQSPTLSGELNYLFSSTVVQELAR